MLHLNVVMRELIIAGTMLRGESFTPVDGYVCVDKRKGVIKEIGEEKIRARVNGIIIPGFINAHVHLGDSVAKDVLFKNLDELVKPPSGIKHQILKSTPSRKLRAAMRSSLSEMLFTGTSHFIDFREGGVKGVKALRSSMQDLSAKKMSIRGAVLGRPESEEELDVLLNECDGLGISGANDLEYEDLVKLRSIARKRGKYFAIHAGERDRSDVDTALSLEPDILIHMTHASPGDLRHVADSGIPIAICPRSNFATGVAGVSKPDVKKMVELGICVALGTDNVMLNSPCLFSEMEFASKIFLIDDVEVLRMATANGAKILDIDGETGVIEAGKTANFTVINKNSNNIRYSKNLMRTIVRRARADDVLAIVNKGMVLRR